jgi:hypothetical protein
MLSAALSLPEGRECHTFIARDVDSQQELFSVDIEQARVRNHRYSFLQSLPAGAYALEGLLQCTTEEGDEELLSLPARFEVLEDDVANAQFRFFTDVSDELSQIDLLFCADLMLQRIQPAGEACVGEMINAEYNVDWHREDCGTLQLVMELQGQEGISEPFSAPQTSVEASLIAPDVIGDAALVLSLQSELGDRLELAVEPLHLIDCEISEEPAPQEIEMCYEADGPEVIDGLLDGDNFIDINGQKIAGFEFSSRDQGRELRAAINALTPLTGVHAELNAEGGLRLKSDRSIELRLHGDAGRTTGLDQLIFTESEGPCEL